MTPQKVQNLSSSYLAVEFGYSREESRTIPSYRCNRRTVTTSQQLPPSFPSPASPFSATASRLQLSSLRSSWPLRVDCSPVLPPSTSESPASEVLSWHSLSGYSAPSISPPPPHSATLCESYVFGGKNQMPTLNERSSEHSVQIHRNLHLPSWFVGSEVIWLKWVLWGNRSTHFQLLRGRPNWSRSRWIRRAWSWGIMWRYSVRPYSRGNTWCYWFQQTVFWYPNLLISSSCPLH